VVEEGACWNFRFGGVKSGWIYGECQRHVLAIEVANIPYESEWCCAGRTDASASCLWYQVSS